MPARGESGIFALADDRPVALVLLGDSWVPQNVVGAPPIHFGREDGVERTLLRVACQSETFLASPWQGDANIRFLWHIGCQSDFDELVSMASRPVYRGSCRMEETKVPFHPVKRPFCRMGSSFSFRSQQNTPLGRGNISRCIVGSRKVRRHYLATRKTPLNTCRILQRSTKGVT